ncbi:serine/threonine protein kinase, partial [Streptomyces sp. A7024]|nr:serine/threonine protein kinase [Streptomyces coryli]
MPGAPLIPTDPQTVGGYRLTRRLGSGGMGVVYLGEDARARPVAVKVMRQELADDRAFRIRFGREVAALRAVDSARTVQVVDVDADAEQPYLVTQYVDGPSLADHVAEHGPLAEPAGQALASALAEALAEIHAAGITHRDLKPSNVLLGPDGPKVIDFGIAQLADATAVTGTGVTVGTPGYLAPEQIGGHRSGPAADVFTWALTVGYAMTGRHSFGTGPSDAVLYRVLHGTPDFDGVPASMLPALLAATRKTPDQRPTAGQLLELLAHPPRPTLAQTRAPAAPP